MQQLCNFVCIEWAALSGDGVCLNWINGPSPYWVIGETGGEGFPKLPILMSTLGMDEHIISYYLLLVVFIKGAILCFEILYFGRFCKLEGLSFPFCFVFMVDH